MSAFILNSAHIDALVNYAIFHRTSVYHNEQYFTFTDNAQELANELVRANVASINYKYRDENAEALPYRIKAGHSLHSAIQILKAINCYVYQSCEHPDFYKSLAYAICQSIQGEAIGNLPGYDDAKWEITGGESIAAYPIDNHTEIMNTAVKAALVTPAKVTVLYDDEPEEMTAVLGQKPDPTDWYKNALSKPVEKPVKHQTVTDPDPEMPKPQIEKGIVNIKAVARKAFVRNGHKTEAKPDPDYNADIKKNEYIRIYGLDRNVFNFADGVHHYGAKTFDLTFKIGDTAEYHSYNLTYTGTITAIGEKTVKIESNGKTHQLDLHTFIWRNRDFDLAKIQKENSEWYD